MENDSTHQKEKEIAVNRNVLCEKIQKDRNTSISFDNLIKSYLSSGDNHNIEICPHNNTFKNIHGEK